MPGGDGRGPMRSGGAGFRAGRGRRPHAGSGASDWLRDGVGALMMALGTAIVQAVTRKLQTFADAGSRDREDGNAQVAADRQAKAEKDNHGGVS